MERAIRFTNADDWWVARDVETEVTTQGETRAEALENLDEAVALQKGKSAASRPTSNSASPGSTPRTTQPVTRNRRPCSAD